MYLFYYFLHRVEVNMKLWLHRVDVKIITHVVSVNNLTPGSTPAFFCILSHTAKQ